MKIVENMVQGSAEWLAFRASRFTASEAPAMLGVSKYVSRDDLLAQKVTGDHPEASAQMQALFDRGHEAEAKARAIAEEIVGQELFPVTVDDDEGCLSASMDGLTMLGDVGWESKLWNEGLAADVRAGRLDEHYKAQMDQQMLVSGAEQILFTCTDGTRERFVSMWYDRDESRFPAIIAGWKQFREDMKEFRPAIKQVKEVAVRPDSLPMISVEVQGSLVIINNVEDFKKAARAQIDAFKTNLETDQDFLDAEANVKWLAESEAKIDLIKEQIAAKAKLEDILNALDDVQQKMMRTTRLALSKQIEAQKANRRTRIVQDAEREFTKFLDEVNLEFLGRGVMVGDGKNRPDFYLAIKGKRSFDMMVSACNDTIAKSKIAVNEIAGKVRRNLLELAKHAEHDFLFPNKQQLALMDFDHLALTIKSKIDDYRKQQEQQEAARVQRHRNTIAGIEAAGEFDEATPYAQLVLTRQRIDKIATGGMEEFALQADNAKAATLSKIDARLRAMRDDDDRRRQEEQVAAKQKAATTTTADVTMLKPPVAAYTLQPLDAAPGSDDLDDVTIHDPQPRTKPTAEQMAGAVAREFSVPMAMAFEWLSAANFKTAAAQWQNSEAA